MVVWQLQRRVTGRIGYGEGRERSMVPEMWMPHYMRQRSNVKPLLFKT